MDVLHHSTVSSPGIHYSEVCLSKNVGDKNQHRSISVSSLRPHQPVSQFGLLGPRPAFCASTGCNSSRLPKPGGEREREEVTRLFMTEQIRWITKARSHISSLTAFVEMIEDSSERYTKFGRLSVFL